MNFQINTTLIPAPSKGWCLNPTGLISGTPSHPFGTPWRVQVESYRGCFFSSSHDPQVPQLLSGVGGVTLSKEP